MLELNADNFLKNTDVAYAECAAGLANLDRIVVCVCSSYSSMTRGYLLPMIYAYWERFFKVVFSEFLVCIEANNVPFKNVNTDIAKFKIKKELSISLKNKNVGHLQELPNNCEIAELLEFFSGYALFFEKPISFADPSDWISTESNVQFAVLEKNCKNLGLDISQIKKTLKESSIELYSNLKELVDARNRIAHGQSFEEVNSSKWELMKGFVLELMTTLQMHLYDFLKDKSKVFSNVV
jgi:hypothetical protein